jgi:hypothetical protein
MQPQPWPSLFAWVVDKLHETTHRPVLVTPMQVGARKRPQAPPKPALAGQVEMDEHTFGELLKLAAEPKQQYIVGRRCLSFLKPPAIRRTDIDVRDGKSVRKRVFVEIELHVHPAPTPPSRVNQ